MIEFPIASSAKGLVMNDIFTALAQDNYSENNQYKISISLKNSFFRRTKN